MMTRCLSLLRRRRAARFLRVLAVAGLLAGLMAIASPARAGEARMAMVVGNADYDALAEVPQATRRARGVAETLEAQGFEVSLLLNGDGATFAAAFDSFERRAGDAAMVLFYFAGHGLRVDGANRLAPIDLRPDAPGAARGWRSGRSWTVSPPARARRSSCSTRAGVLGPVTRAAPRARARACPRPRARRSWSWPRSPAA